MTQFVQIRRGGLVEESSAYVRALALAREAEELAVLGCLSGDVLEKLRIDALDCVLELARAAQSSDSQA
ncbi:MAG: hypothetical protein KDB16_03300 [Acidimicrobiales bacterium]|nr:hypothetical protein [Acidimicrobiales bacterium]